MYVCPKWRNLINLSNLSNFGLVWIWDSNSCIHFFVLFLFAVIIPPPGERTVQTSPQFRQHSCSLWVKYFDILTSTVHHHNNYKNYRIKTQPAASLVYYFYRFNGQKEPSRENLGPNIITQTESAQSHSNESFVLEKADKTLIIDHLARFSLNVSLCFASLFKANLICHWVLLKQLWYMYHKKKVNKYLYQNYGCLE